MMDQSKRNVHTDLLEFFTSKADTLWKKTDQLFLACSGGMDSVVLGHLLLSAGYTFEILHVNFQLRGEESERDESFVRSLATEWEMKLQVKRFDTVSIMKGSGKGVQETARNLRYDWFDEVMQADPSKVKWLLTAHHADDQVETIAMNFFRGTGIAGLRGMKEKKGSIIRPLLSFFQEHIQSYAISNNLKWVDDSSNQSTHYTRNLFRLEILPMIEKAFPAVRQNIIHNAERMSDIEQVYTTQMDKLIQKLLVQKGQAFSVPVNLLKKQSPLDAVMHHLFSPFGFSSAQLPELKKLFDAASGKFIVSPTHRVLRNREWLLIDPIQDQDSSIVIINQQEPVTAFPLGKIMMEEHHGEPDTHPMHAFIDKTMLEYPLILRPWKSGDYFYPLGMRKKKKLSRFMTDIKLSRTEKEQQWVLESNKRIVWVIGRRIDDRFKVKSAETPCVKLVYSPDKN